MQYMRHIAELTAASGSKSLPDRSLRYTRFEHQKVLSFLLQSSKDKADISNQFLNTLSAGAAMIGLAVSANGADILVECVIESGTIQINRRLTSGESLCKSSRIIRLWLKQPPTTIMQDLNSRGSIVPNTERDDKTQLFVPVYDRELELLLYVAQQLNCDLRGDKLLELWQRGIAAGQLASWNCRRGKDIKVNVFYVDEFFECDIPFDLARLADGFFDTLRYDRRSLLARKAASLIYECFKVNNYDSFANLFHSTTQLTLIAIFIGSVKALISNGQTSLRMYAWTSDVTILLQLVQRSASDDTGLSSFLILQEAGRIWGGLAPRFFEMPSSGNTMYGRDSTMQSTIGIVCPQLVLLSNILLEPRVSAQRGIDAGLLSCYEGLTPLLPQDQHSGFILAASPSYTHPPITLDLSLHNALSQIHLSDPGPGSAFGKLTFSVEPATTAHGTMGIGLCVWSSGDFLMMINPSKARQNLLASRDISGPMQCIKKPNIIRKYAGSSVAHLGSNALRQLHSGLLVSNGSCIIDVGPEIDWLVVAAGVCVQPPVLCLTSIEDIKMVLDPHMLLEDDTVVLMSRPEHASTSLTITQRGDDAEAMLTWYDIGRNNRRNRVQVGGLSVEI